MSVMCGKSFGAEGAEALIKHFGRTNCNVRFLGAYVVIEILEYGIDTIAFLFACKHTSMTRAKGSEPKAWKR